MKKSLSIYLLLGSILLLGAFALLVAIFHHPYPLKYENEILTASQKFDVSSALIASVICAESHFNPDAKSSKGAMGLMQLMPSTAKWLSANLEQSFELETLATPQTNITLGTAYLAYLLKKFPSIETTICAYNAGEGNVMLWLQNPKFSSDKTTLTTTPFPETNAYLKKVLTALPIYEKKFNKLK